MKKEKRYLIIILAITILLAIVILSNQSKHELVETQNYTVQVGDTLWSIASNYRPRTMSIQEYIFNLQEFNNISPEIYPQQEIQILIYEEV